VALSSEFGSADSSAARSGPRPWRERPPSSKITLRAARVGGSIVSMTSSSLTDSPVRAAGMTVPEGAGSLRSPGLMSRYFSPSRLSARTWRGVAPERRRAGIDPRVSGHKVVLARRYVSQRPDRDRVDPDLEAGAQAARVEQLDAHELARVAAGDDHRDQQQHADGARSCGVGRDPGAHGLLHAGPHRAASGSSAVSSDCGPAPHRGWNHGWPAFSPRGRGIAYESAPPCAATSCWESDSVPIRTGVS
jgi:hypothetical protein